MEYVALVLAIVAGVASTIAAATAAALKSTHKDVERLKEDNAKLVKEKKDLGDSANVELMKREQVIKDLKAELAKMEEDLAANKDPAAVRSRLGKLLSETPG
jgi:septal ring factor EnvC (AmiA/AmiB activator)